MFIRDEINDNECNGFGELFEFFDELRHGCESRSGGDHDMKKLRSMMEKIKQRERRSP